MKLKSLLALSTIVGAAALLQNKERRERVFKSARELIGNARNRLAQMAPEADVSGASPASSSAF